ncbi:hypothetical protein CLAIMM_14089 [Cladophialophora immunda]|nr:hypothetical protein CLAIMM_14089 [Cladophialophora immunda]
MFLEFAKVSFEPEGAKLDLGPPWVSKLFRALKVVKKPWGLEGTTVAPVLPWILKLFRIYSRDTIYKPEKLESILKSVLGSATTMSDCSYATELGAKLCVLVATVLKKPSCRIFTNYNGKGSRNGKQHASVIKPEEGGAKALIWEVARAASAAPFYFPPKYVSNVGSFQDAGLLQNDPTITAVTEAKALYPLMDQADIILSLGTGVPQPAHDTTSRQQRASSRTVNLIWEKLRDQHVQEVFACNPRYHRLNYVMEQDYGLDNISQMRDLKSRVEEDTSLSEDVKSVAESVVPLLFYFELADLPTRRSGKYTGIGHIRCSVLGNEPAFKALLQTLKSDLAQFFFNGELVIVSWDSAEILDNQAKFINGDPPHKRSTYDGRSAHMGAKLERQFRNARSP